MISCPTSEASQPLSLWERSRREAARGRDFASLSLTASLCSAPFPEGEEWFTSLTGRHAARRNHCGLDALALPAARGGEQAETPSTEPAPAGSGGEEGAAE